MWVGARDCRAAGCVGYVRRRRILGRHRLLGLGFLRQLACFVALGQNLDGEVRAVALAQAAADAVGCFDYRVVSQQEAVLGTDLDADIAALAPLIDPSNVDVVNDRGIEMDSFFGGIYGSNGRISIVTTAAR
jgi:hypothetical protein